MLQNSCVSVSVASGYCIHVSSNEVNNGSIFDSLIDNESFNVEHLTDYIVYRQVY